MLQRLIISSHVFVLFECFLTFTRNIKVSILDRWSSRMMGCAPFVVQTYICLKYKGINFVNFQAILPLSLLSILQAFLKYGANYSILDGAGYAAVHIAAVNDLTGKLLELLHNHGASLNERDSTYKETPLHKAVKTDMIENFKFLAMNGADPNIPDDTLETVLHKAATCTKPFIWMTLMKIGGNPNMYNRMGLSPLDKAHKAKNQMAISIMKEYDGK